MEKKYLFFDIDGTLTDRSTGEIVPSAREALTRLEENGHFVAIATGRAHYKARKFTDANGFKNMVCCGGNGCVIDNELVENIPLDKDGCIKIIHQAKELYTRLMKWLIDTRADIPTELNPAYIKAKKQ